MKKLIVLGFIVLLMSGVCFGQKNNAPVEGTWKIVEYSVESTDESWTTTSPQPGLFIFGNGYYSIMYIRDKQPRPLLPDSYTRNTLTNEQIRSCFMGFVANSGTYKIDGKKIKVQPKVALEPNFMKDTSAEYEFSLKGNTLLLKRKVTSGTREYKLIRLE